jgi:DNA-binding transcriptional MerR regulator
MHDDPREPLLSSGEFAARTRLTPKALRIYNQMGLFRPAFVDDTNGYRRYSTAQVRTGQLIGLLRSAELPLSDIAAVLDDLGAGDDAAAARLDALAAEATRRHDDHLLVIRHVQATLKGDNDPMFPVHTRRIAAARAMSSQRRLHATETDRFPREAKATFAAHLGTTPDDRVVHLELSRGRRRREPRPPRGRTRVLRDRRPNRSDRDPYRTRA